MELIIIVLQLTVAAVLAVAAIGKFLDLPGSRRAVRDFGVPSRYASPLGTALPFGELVLAVALLPASTARWAAAGACLLFLTFNGAILYNLRQGRRPNCHCFGQLQSAPAGWPTVSRNSILTVLAAVVVLTGGRSPVETVADLPTVGQLVLIFGVLIAGTAAAQVWLLRKVFTQQERMTAEIESLRSALASSPSRPAASLEARPAPTFDLQTPGGARLSLADLLNPGRPVLLLFASPDCQPCSALVPEIVRWSRDFASKLTIGVISQGSPHDNQVKFADRGIAHIGIEHDREISIAYGVRGTPTAVVIQPNGMMQDAIAEGSVEIQKLVARAVGTHPPDRTSAPLVPMVAGPPPREGSEDARFAPHFDLPTLSGGRMTLSDLLAPGKPVLLITSSPDCSWCTTLYPDLAEWKRRFADQLQIGVVSRGTIEQHRELGGMFGPERVGLQEDREVQLAYGTFEVPSAFLIDHDGMIRAPIATGRSRVIDLLASVVSGNHTVLGKELDPPRIVNGDASLASALGHLVVPPTGPEPGTPALRLPLPDLDGGYLSVDDFHGQPLIMVFVSPNCEFSQRMLPEFREWETEADGAFAPVLVISRGTPEANRQLRLRSRIVIDDDFRFAASVGVTGTPAAIRLDTAGRVDSALAFGEDAVLDLLYTTTDAPATPVV